MFCRLRGTGRTSRSTENERPTGCPGVGYGSCPTISTRTSSNGRVNARSTRSPAGRYRRPAAVSEREELPHRSDLAGDGCERPRPFGVDELVEGSSHRQSVTGGSADQGKVIQSGVRRQV